MNILLTGGTGFGGSAFSIRARARGHRIGALVRPATAHTHGLQDENNLSWLHGTMADPPWRAIEKFAPEACVHAAWIATPGIYLESSENRDHLRWSIDLARRLREMGLRRFISLGTCIEYKIDPTSCVPLREDKTPVQPLSFYAR